VDNQTNDDVENLANMMENVDIQKDTKANDLKKDKIQV